MKRKVIKYKNLIDYIVEELKRTTGEDYSFRCVTESGCDIYVFSDRSFSDQPCSTDYFVIAKNDLKVDEKKN